MSGAPAPLGSTPALRLVNDSVQRDDRPRALHGADAIDTGATDVAALVHRALRGDEDAFESLYRAHSGAVYALCFRMSGDAVFAQELTQSVFIRVWERLAS